jgi:hypothetical protein
MFDIVPVFARTLPCAAVPFIRVSSEPSTPAIGSAAMNGDAADASNIRCSTMTSASGEIASRRERPEPSTS